MPTVVMLPNIFERGPLLWEINDCDELQEEMTVGRSIRRALKRGGRFAADSLHHVPHPHMNFHRSPKEQHIVPAAPLTPPPSDEEMSYIEPEELAAPVELPIDVMVMIVEEINCPKTLRNVAFASKTMHALAYPRLYANIGICISDEKITMFSSRATSFFTCNRHIRSRPIALETMADEPALAALVHDLTILDDRQRKNVDVPDKVAKAISQMRNLKAVRWISSTKTTVMPSMKSPNRIPSKIQKIFENFEYTAPQLEKWSVEFPAQSGRSRGEDPQPVVIPRSVRCLEIKNAQSVYALRTIGKFLRSQEGRLVKSLTLEGAPTWSQALKKGALLEVLPYYEEGEDVVLRLETLDLRKLLFTRAEIEKLPFNRIDRSSLKHLRFGKVNGYGRILDSMFTGELAPNNLETLHLAGYYDTCHRFLHTAPAVQELSLAIDVEKEAKTGQNILRYLERSSHKLERLALTFVRPNGTIVSSDSPIFDHELLEVDYINKLAAFCTEVKELALHMTFHSASANVDRLCDTISRFPKLTAILMDTRSENDLTPCMMGSSEPDFYIGGVEMFRARKFVEAHTAAHGPSVKYARVDDAVFHVHHGIYEDAIWKMEERGMKLTFMSRDDMDEEAIPAIMRFQEMEGEADAWMINCLEADNEDTNCC